jgi:hypothetical protein
MQGTRFCPSSQSRSKRRFWLIYIQGQERRETIQRFSLYGRRGSHMGDSHFAKGEDVNIMDRPGERRVESWDPTEVEIQIYGNVGLVIGLAEVADVLRGERRHIRFRYTHVWVRRNGSWQSVHRHTTRVATIEGPEPPR